MKPFILQTDSSGVGIGAVLSQLDEDDADHPVGYYSRQLRGAESRYTVSEQECLAVVEGVKHFRVYLLGAEFTIVTDHSSLVYLEKMKDENGRLARWAMALMPYMYTIVHRPGSKNKNADGMSRQSWPTAGRDRGELLLSKGEEGKDVTGPSLCDKVTEQ